MLTTGPRNLITDVPGLLVGNAEDPELGTGTTVLTSEDRFVAAVHVMGGAPGTRETDLLAPENTVDRVDALVLSGGSAFGLDAASGVIEGLRAQGRGFALRDLRIPIVPAAIVFDIGHRARADWPAPPWHDLGRRALAAAGADFALGSAGGGYGATSATLKGGLGSASQVLDGGATVGALVIANPVGCVTVGESRHFWAAPFEIGGEFGGHGPATGPAPQLRTKLDLEGATVIAIVATDLALTKSEAKRLAVMAHDGIARAVVPSHTPYDGDLVFAVSTGQRPSDSPALDLVRTGHAAATCLARAISRAIYEATPRDGDTLASYRARFRG